MSLEVLSENVSIRLIRGRESVLDARDLLTGLADRCGQHGVVRDLAYFLHKPGVLKRTPVLILIVRGDRKQGEALTYDHLTGAVLLFEYSIAGMHTRMFTSNDRSGRGTVIAPPHLRSAVARCAAEHLLRAGAHVLMFSFREGDKPAAIPSWPAAHSFKATWAIRTRQVHDYLPLRASYDETLAQIGQRTRRDIRYYRRRAENELGCTFHSAVEISTADLLAFNSDCMYAVSDKVAAWRHATLGELSDPLLVGMRDRHGRWLSLLGGRRFNGSSEVLWQMNRDGIAKHSLSLVMRSYFIEHEIAHGAERLYFEGGIQHPICNSFASGTITDLAVVRSTPTALLARKLGHRFIYEDNELAKMLFDGKSTRPSAAETTPSPASTELQTSAPTDSQAKSSFSAA